MCTRIDAQPGGATRVKAEQQPRLAGTAAKHPPQAIVWAEVEDWPSWPVRA